MEGLRVHHPDILTKLLGWEGGWGGGVGVGLQLQD